MGPGAAHHRSPQLTGQGHVGPITCRAGGFRRRIQAGHVGAELTSLRTALLATRHGLNRLHHLDVARAAAEVAGDGLTDLGLGGIRVPIEQSGRGDEETGRAETALHGSLGHEGLLQRAHPAVGRQPLDGRDLVALRVADQGEAGVDRRAVQQHHAGPALPVATSFLGPGETQPFAKTEQQRFAGLGVDVTHEAVHVQPHEAAHATPPPSVACRHASAKARLTTTPSIIRR